MVRPLSRCRPIREHQDSTGRSTSNLVRLVEVPAEPSEPVQGRRGGESRDEPDCPQSRLDCGPAALDAGTAPNLGLPLDTALHDFSLAGVLRNFLVNAPARGSVAGDFAWHRHPGWKRKSPRRRRPPVSRVVGQRARAFKGGTRGAERRERSPHKQESPRLPGKDGHGGFRGRFAPYRRITVFPGARVQLREAEYLGSLQPEGVRHRCRDLRFICEGDPLSVKRGG